MVFDRLMTQGVLPKSFEWVLDHGDAHRILVGENLKFVLFSFYKAYSKVFLIINFISLVSRCILKILPGFGSLLLRQHPHFFTKESISYLKNRTNFQLIYCDYVETGHLLLIGKKVKN